MIDEIHVSNLALIRQAEMRPSARMTVITGETGAGKTALLASCRLLMGQRADAMLVREGEPEASVQGRVILDEGSSEREVVVDRRLGADGRSRVRIDGQMASVGELSDLVSPSIDLCSQHDQRLLSSQSVQRGLLDSWAGVAEDGILERYRGCYEAAMDAHSALEEARKVAQASDERLEDARFRLGKIESVGPSQQDYDELMASLAKAENAELLARAAGESSTALSGEGGALDSLNGAIAFLEEGSRVDPSLKDAVQSVREAVYVLEDVARDVSAYSDSMDLDVSMLDAMQERVSAYQSLIRAYGPTIEDVIAAGEEARTIISAHENADAAIREAEEEARRAEAALAECAEALGHARAAAAPDFSATVNSVLARLEMSGATLSVQMERLPRDGWTLAGPDEVRFMFQPAEGMQPRPLSRIASGGELSRVMLAVHVAMGDGDEVSTLIFDEVDSGVGGAVAGALGDVLRELSKTHQVIVVTHLAQIAAKADVHYVACKHDAGGSPETSIVEVNGDSREEEVARMLSGSITESSLAHAKELLGM